MAKTISRFSWTIAQSHHRYRSSSSSAGGSLSLPFPTPLPHRRFSLVSLSPLQPYRSTKMASGGGGGGGGKNNGGSGGGGEGSDGPDAWTLFKEGLKEGYAQSPSGSIFDTYNQVLLLLLTALGWFIEKKTGWIGRWFEAAAAKPSVSGINFAKSNTE